MTQNTKKTQIIRKDGKNCLMEVNTQSFSIDKLQFVFSNYNPNRPKGQRTTDRVVIYMDFPAALEFAQSILDGRLSKQLVEASKKFEQSKKPWDKDVVLAMGGTPNPKNRTDGKAESRIMKAQLGTKNPIALIASTGPGVVNDKGLITPEKGSKTDHSVMLTLSAKDIREVALMIRMHIQAYLQSEYVKGLWSNQMVQQDQQAYVKQNYTTPQQNNYSQQGQHNQQTVYQNNQHQASQQATPQHQQGNYMQQHQQYPNQPTAQLMHQPIPQDMIYEEPPFPY